MRPHVIGTIRNPKATCITRPTRNAAGQKLAAVQPDGTTAPLFHGIGPLHVPISTKSEQAQKYFDQGFTLMYGFNHHEAIRSFKEAARLDPTCGICWWGVALSYGPNINQPMEKDAIPLAWQALQTAQSLRADETPKEQAYIDAVCARYSETGEGRETLDRAYADAMAKLVAAYPDDLDAATLYAESLMDLMPWDYYQADGTPKPDTKILLAQLERVKAANPDHPGALHYYIHAVEATTTPERAEPAADELGDLVPVAGHLVHMPAHIYLRVGRYHDAITANEAAAAGGRRLHRAVQRAGFLSGGLLPAQPAFPVVRGDDGRPEETVARHRAQDGAARADRFRAHRRPKCSSTCRCRSTRSYGSRCGTTCSPNRRRPRACRSQPRCGTTAAASRTRTKARSTKRRSS